MGCGSTPIYYSIRVLRLPGTHSSYQGNFSVLDKQPCESVNLITTYYTRLGLQFSCIFYLLFQVDAKLLSFSPLLGLDSRILLHCGCFPVYFPLSSTAYLRLKKVKKFHHPFWSSRDFQFLILALYLIVLACCIWGVENFIGLLQERFFVSSLTVKSGQIT